MKNFREAVLEGIPKTLPKQKNRSINISHAPNRKHILNNEEKGCNEKWIILVNPLK